MIRVAHHVPSPHDGTAYYRSIGPNHALEATKPKEFFFSEPGTLKEWSWPTLTKYHLAFFQRPSTQNELDAINMCRSAGVPVIVDYDDNLFEVPTDNPVHEFYRNAGTQKVVAQCIASATVVTVSTLELKRRFQLPGKELNKHVFVVRNSINDVQHPAIKNALAAKHAPQTNPTILWRGSNTHMRDLMEYGEPILEVAHQEGRKPPTFTFAGYNPWFLTERMKPKQAVVMPLTSVGEFMNALIGIAPEIGIVPLHNSGFNRAKSNIAWLEMTLAGAACLVPEWEEWCMPGAVTYQNAEDFRAGLLFLLEMPPENRAELRQQSWDHIKQHFLLSKQLHRRAEILKFAAGLGEEPVGGAPNGQERSLMEVE